jgi:hypothetical protein
VIRAADGVSVTTDTKAVTRATLTYGDNHTRFVTRFALPVLVDSFTPQEREAVLANEPELAGIAALDGVDSISVVHSYIGYGSRYELRVTKGTAFAWEEMEPQIVALLERRHERLYWLKTQLDNIEKIA